MTVGKGVTPVLSAYTRCVAEELCSFHHQKEFFMSTGIYNLAVTNLYASLGVGRPPLSVVAPNTTFYIVVQMQAGDEAWDLGIHYNLQVLLQDITNNYTNILNEIIQGNLRDPCWPMQSSLFHFPVVSGAAGTVYQSSAFLTAGFRDSGVSFRVDFPIVVHSVGVPYLAERGPTEQVQNMQKDVEPPSRDNV